jgi:hypothetical protein
MLQHNLENQTDIAADFLTHCFSPVSPSLCFFDARIPPRLRNGLCRSTKSLGLVNSDGWQSRTAPARTSVWAPIRNSRQRGR